MSRHLPTFVERTSHGLLETDPYTTLLDGRIVFLGTAIDDAVANDFAAQLICLESLEPAGQVSDLTIQADEISRMRHFMESTLARHTGRSVPDIHADIERDLFLTADQAITYGLADQVVPSRKNDR